MNCNFAFQPKTPLRVKALIRLSVHPSLVKHVTQFRTKFPSWEKSLPTLLKELGAKRNKKKKKAKTESLQIATSKDKKENVSNNTSLSDLEEDENISTSTSQDINMKAEKSKYGKISKKRKEIENSQIDITDTSSSEIKITERNLVKVKRFSEILKSDDDDDDDSIEEKDIAYPSISNNNSNNNNKSANEKVVDSFFLCEDGETGYLTTMKKVSGENGEGNKKTVRQSLWRRDGNSGFNQKERRGYGQILEPKNSNLRFSQQRVHKFGDKSKKPLGPKIMKADERKQTKIKGEY